MSNAPIAPASLPSSSRQRSFLAAVSAAPFSNLVPVSDSASNSRTIDSYTAKRLPQRKVTTLTVGEGEPARVLRRKASVTISGAAEQTKRLDRSPSALDIRRPTSRTSTLSCLSLTHIPRRDFFPHDTPSRASITDDSLGNGVAEQRSDSSSPSDSDSSKSAFRSGMLKLKKSTASLRAALRSSSHKHDKAPPLPLQIPSSSSTSSFGEENLVTPPLPTAKPLQPATDFPDSRQPPTSPTTPRRSRTRPRTSQQQTANVSQDRLPRHCSRTLRRAASTSQIGRRLPVLPDTRPPSPPPVPRAARTQ
ncbi:hypothetical protein NBRC10512v2_005035 [Rhodotorula toruloides]